VFVGKGGLRTCEMCEIEKTESEQRVGQRGCTTSTKWGMLILQCSWPKLTHWPDGLGLARHAYWIECTRLDKASFCFWISRRT